MIELKNKRTANAKHFDDNGKNVMHAHAGHIHYFNKLGVGDGEKRWREIDWKFNFDEEKRVWYFEYHSYHPFIPEYSDGWVEFRDLFDDKDQTIKYKAVCEKVKGELIEKDDTNPNFDNNPDNKAVLYKDAFGKDKDYLVYNTRSSLVKVATVNNPNEQKEDVKFVWEVELPKQEEKELSVYRARDKNDLEKLDIKIDNRFLSYSLKLDTEKVFDSDKQTLVGEDKKDGKEWFTYLRTYKAWDSDGNSIIIKARLFEKDGKRYLEKTIPVEFLQKAVGRVFTDTTTSFYAGAGDGSVDSDTDASWDTVHDATSGGTAYPTSAYVTTAYSRHKSTNNTYLILRGFLPFDTSSLSGNTVSSASLYITPQAKNDDNSSNIRVVETTQASETTLSTADYNQCGSVNSPTTYCTTNVSDFTVDSYKEMALSDTSIINTTGYTKLGLREGNYDCDDTAHPTNSYDGIGIYFSEQTGTDKDPYLEVTYSAATSSFTPYIILT